jgi:RsiW-degrading membrane proteinase PrsW (M82 family)
MVIELLPLDYLQDWQNSRPGYTALIVVGVLAIAFAFLMRSFIKHVRKAREPWDDDPE